MDEQKYFDKCDEIIEQNICTEDELTIAVLFGGANIKTLNTLIRYKKEGWSNFGDIPFNN